MNEMFKKKLNCFFNRCVFCLYLLATFHLTVLCLCCLSNNYLSSCLITYFCTQQQEMLKGGICVGNIRNLLYKV